MELALVDPFEPVRTASDMALGVNRENHWSFSFVNTVLKRKMAVAYVKLNLLTSSTAKDFIFQTQSCCSARLADQLGGEGEREGHIWECPLYNLSGSQVSSRVLNSVSRNSNHPSWELY